MDISLQKNGALLFRALCSILFFLYSIAYTCFYQAQELALMVHRLTGGVPLYLNRWVVGLLITGSLVLLQLGVFVLLGRSKRLLVASYVPSFLLLMLLSAFTGVAPFSAFLPGLCVSVALVVMALYLLLFCIKRQQTTHEEENMSDFPYLSMWFMVLLMFVTAYGGAVKGILHRRLVMETLIKNRQYEKALEVGKRDLETDSALTSLRALALASEGVLGEHLFDYSLVGTSQAMMPNDKTVKWLSLNAKTLDSLFVIVTPHDEYITQGALEKWTEEHKLTKPAYDYMLCGYLLDRQLDKFAARVFLYYPNNNELPRHYREALTLYMHQRSNPVAYYSDNLMETDYQDFQDLEGKYKNFTERFNVLRSVYGNTYWFYYTYGK
ncbi:DUF6057 family protein [Hoylesella shahii]|jgi:hypothetical protein|uniref:DUF6057 family protein n=1 Tax=Hoylesella shahii TaxID=228603 RepID=UPI001CADF73A|nr:DUF6057 family protein [Hoylesella shahii]MBF1577017.1 hypothetical protein [Hoylesella shahii]